jgi:hypothetical protein
MRRTEDAGMQQCGHKSGHLSFRINPKSKLERNTPMIKRIRIALTVALVALTIAFSAGALDGFLPTAYTTPHVLAGGGNWGG